jgi:hypothetical protein
MPIDKNILHAITPDLPTGHGAFGDDINKLRVLGQATINLFMAFIVVTIIAVVLSPRSNTVGIVSSFFNLLKWLVALVLTPLSQGSVVSLTQYNSGPAGSLAQQGATSSVPSGSGATSSNTVNGAGSTVGSTLPLPPGWTTTYQSGDTADSASSVNGGSVSGYHAPGVNSVTVNPDGTLTYGGQTY